MSTFSCNVVELEIEKHPDADALEVARIGDYKAVVAKGMFKSGDLAVYIPESAVLPDPVIEKLGLVGRLSGSNKNRVKAIKLRGVLSQGLVYPLDNGFCVFPDNTKTQVALDDDLTEPLGIHKYEPEIPAHMSGEVFNAGDLLLAFDVENIKKFPMVFSEGEPVEITEKIHGTFCGIAILPEAFAEPHKDNLLLGRIAVYSKGLGSYGLAFKANEKNNGNLYLRTVGLFSEILMDKFGKKNEPVYILGEIFGKGIQDLSYGGLKPEFRWFDICSPRQGKMSWNTEDLVFSLDFLSKPTVLYTGGFKKEIVDELTNGKESISGHESHIREGVVIRAIDQRKILKSVSEAYLLRKGGTELN